MELKFKLTELEKTILLLVLALSKGKKYLEEDLILSKFARRKGKMVKISIKRLIKNDLLVKHLKEKSYKLTKKGLKEASKLLHEGVSLWKR